MKIAQLNKTKVLSFQVSILLLNNTTMHILPHVNSAFRQHRYLSRETNRLTNQIKIVSHENNTKLIFLWVRLTH